MEKQCEKRGERGEERRREERGGRRGVGAKLRPLTHPGGLGGEAPSGIVVLGTWTTVWRR
eukprot:scaffold109069_cov31-Tisochrysis_lutea.AAC.5